MQSYILALDQGTTGSTALLIGHDLAVAGKVTVDFPQHYPQPGWVEHDPEELWFSVCQAIRRLLEQTVPLLEHPDFAARFLANEYQQRIKRTLRGIPCLS